MKILPYVFITYIIIVIGLFGYQPIVETIQTSNHKPLEIPLQLEKIAFCESGGNQFNLDGTVKRGIINPLDIGKFQINLKYHQTRAEAMGLNLFTLKGNTEYALWLYKTEGSSPWNWSKSCWGK